METMRSVSNLMRAFPSLETPPRIDLDVSTMMEMVFPTTMEYGWSATEQMHATP